MNSLAQPSGNSGTKITSSVIQQKMILVCEVFNYNYVPSALNPLCRKAFRKVVVS